MRNLYLIVSRAIHFNLLALVFLVASSCSTLQYDQSADVAITKLQTSIHLRINNWVSGAASLNYLDAENLKFYDQAEAELTALEQRMESIPDSATQKLPIIFSNISQILSSMRNVHKKQCPSKENCKLSPVYLKATQAQIDAPFASLLSFELALKAGSGGATQATSTTKNADQSKN